MRLFGLIGNPLTHSYSRKYFSEKFQREGWTDCRYELYPLTTIAELPQLIKELPALEGLNVTIPYKKEVISFLDFNHLPEGLMACNCIRLEKEGLAGFNTDITGFERSLQPLLGATHKKALVLGSGGAAEAVRFVLEKLNIQHKTVSRQVEGKDKISYEDLDRDTIRDHTLIINTTPLGTFPSVNEFPPIPYEHLGSGHLLYDLVYNPGETVFLRKGKQQGASTKNGEEMLMIQAEESWRIWNEY